jgi:parallel beta-helix repeat protein
MSDSSQGRRSWSSVIPLLLLLPMMSACTADSTVAPTGITPRAASFERFGHAGRTVSPSGTDAGNCTTSPCRTINYAIGQAVAGDVIAVLSGTYHESVSITKSLTVVGTNATIDAANLSSPPNGVVIAGAAAAGTVLTGFTVRNAGLEGIFVNRTTNIRIENNVVINNDAYGPNNPLCVDQPDDCGEAIHLQSVTNSTVLGNRVQDNVGGILLTDEDGPTFGIMIRDNLVLNNTLDCGITLASHHFSLTAPAAPGVAGIYNNTVLHNTSIGNGAAGIGVFAGPPGAAAWGNIVSGNVSRNNGFAGIMIHSHTPHQYVNDNVITNNTLSGNGIDDDNPFDDAPTGISIFSAVIPIPHTVVSANTITDEHYGIVAVNTVTLSGLPSNKIASSVAVPIAIH